MVYHSLDIYSRSKFNKDITFIEIISTTFEITCTKFSIN